MSTDLEDFRAETRAWLEANCPTEMRSPMESEKDACWGGRDFKFQSEAQQVWMQRMIEQILPIFRDKCITNNRIESKHSQIKRTGKLRKQKNPNYLDKLFQLQEYIVQTGHLPEIFFTRRPLYKNLIKTTKKSPVQIQYSNNGKQIIQTVLSGYI